MSALWILFVFVFFLHFEHHDAAFPGNKGWTPEQLIMEPYENGEGKSGLWQIPRSAERQAKPRITNMPKEDEENVTVAEFEEAMAKVRESANNIDTELSALQVQLTDATQDSNEQFTAHNERIIVLENSHKSIGFTAYLDEVVSVSYQQGIPFTSVGTNIGGGYDAPTSRFFCPVDGLYFFSVTTFTSLTNSVVQLVRQGLGPVAAYSNNKNTAQGGVSWVVKCDKGDQVWCRLMNDRSNIVNTYDDIPVSLVSFAGFLITGI